MNVNTLMEWFQTEYPEITKDYINSDHHYDLQNLNPYHIEGSVWTHLCMCMKMCEVLDVSDVIKYAVLFHDLGKPATEEKLHERSRVAYKGHEGVSFFKAVGILNKLGLDEETKTRILYLISLHTDLYKLIGTSPDFLGGSINSKFFKKFKNNSDLVKDLVKVTMCDGLGRFYTQGRDIDLYKLEEYMEVYIDALEEEVFDTSWKVHTVTCLIGLPCSGKSTWVLENKTNEIVASRDALVEEKALRDSSTYNEAWEKYRKDLDREFNAVVNQAIIDEKDVIIDKTHMSPKSRRRSLSRFPKNYKRKAVLFLTDFEEIQKREKIRSKKLNKSLSPDVYFKFMTSFQVPLYDEFDEIEIVYT